VVAGRRSTDVPLARNLSGKSRDGSSHWLQSVSASPVPRSCVRTLVDLTEYYYTRESSLGVSRNSGMEHVDTHSTISIHLGGNIVERFLDQHDGW
jgi:hypothetical protein